MVRKGSDIHDFIPHLKNFFFFVYIFTLLVKMRWVMLCVMAINFAYKKKVPSTGCVWTFFCHLMLFCVKFMFNPWVDISQA